MASTGCRATDDARPVARVGVRVVAVAAVLVAGAALGGCSPGRRDDGFTLDDARAFDEFALFHAGDSVAGLSLETISRTSTEQ
jgi:hypothetical protein